MPLDPEEKRPGCYQPLRFSLAFYSHDLEEHPVLSEEQKKQQAKEAAEAEARDARAAKRDAKKPKLCA